jgi:pectin methylesterase-like acyl-CoA thioesterase
MIAAPSTLKEDKFGFLFLNSKLKSNITDEQSVYVGRP